MREDMPIRKIGDVCEVIPGQSPKSKFYNDEGNGLPFYQGKKRFTEKFIDTPVKWTSNITKEAIEGDILMSVRAPVGPVNFATQKICIGRGLAAIRAKEKLDRDYLFYFFLKNEADLESTSGAVFDSINSKQIRNIKIPIPPIPEQKRIVAILDEAFEAIDQAKANIERNIQNAEELFQSKLNEIFSQRGDGWISNKLKDITNKIGSGATPRGGKKNYKESGISLIRSLNIYDEGFEKEKLAFIDEKQAEKLSNVELCKGDVLLNITGASVARCCVVPENYLPARVNQHVSIIRLKQGVMNEYFLHYLLISKQYKDRLLGIGEQGATRQAITKSQIQDFEVSYPSEISEQVKLIDIMNEYRDVSTALKDMYESKLKSLEELKKSILQKAFSGELTAGEPGFSGLEDEPDGLVDGVNMAAEPGVEYEVE